MRHIDRDVSVVTAYSPGTHAVNTSLTLTVVHRRDCYRFFSSKNRSGSRDRIAVPPHRCFVSFRSICSHMLMMMMMMMVVVHNVSGSMTQDRRGRGRGPCMTGRRLAACIRV